jgi:hypothetical protein
VKERYYRRYQWEGEGEKLQSLSWESEEEEIQNI